jgi:hypothetical protein
LYSGEQLIDSGANGIKGAEEAHDFSDPLLPCQAGLLELNSEARPNPLRVRAPGHPKDLDVPSIRVGEPFEDFDRGRFTRAVRAQETKTLSLANAQVQPTYGHHFPVALLKISGDDREPGVFPPEGSRIGPRIEGALSSRGRQ